MKKYLQLAVVSLGLAVAGSSASAQGLNEPNWWSGGWGHMASGGIMMLVVWGGLIVLAVVLVRYLVTGQRPSADRLSALEILQQRFARGELDQQEYDARRRTLSEPRP